MIISNRYRNMRWMANSIEYSSISVHKAG